MAEEIKTREWKTIKEYQDIFFDFYNGIAKITRHKPSALSQRVHSYHYFRN